MQWSTVVDVPLAVRIGSIRIGGLSSRAGPSLYPQCSVRVSTASCSQAHISSTIFPGERLYLRAKFMSNHTYTDGTEMLYDQEGLQGLTSCRRHLWRWP